MKRRDAGTDQSFEKFNAAALIRQSGGKVKAAEREEECGRYI